jgi:hypothetical protein
MLYFIKVEPNGPRSTPGGPRWGRLKPDRTFMNKITRTIASIAQPAAAIRHAAAAHNRTELRLIILPSVKL